MYNRGVCKVEKLYNRENYKYFQGISPLKIYIKYLRKSGKLPI